MRDERREKTKGKNALRLAVLVAFVATLAPGASAVQCEVSFIGNVSSVPTELASAFTLGDPVSGSFVIESTTPDSDPSATFGLYLSPTDFAFQFGTYSASAAGGNAGDSVLVTDDNGYDEYHADATRPITAPTVNGFDALNLDLALEDDTASVFSSDALPLTLRRPDFNLAEATIILRNQSQPPVSRTVAATIEFIDVQPLPEPPSTALGLVACTLLAAGRRLRTRWK